MNTRESEYHRVVRHETGHTLGFPHEHMRRELVARIDPQRAYAYFLATQGWDRAMVDAQVLTALDDASIFGTPADQDSIMCYQLPGQITVDGQPIRGGARHQRDGRRLRRPHLPARGGPGTGSHRRRGRGRRLGRGRGPAHARLTAPAGRVRPVEDSVRARGPRRRPHTRVRPPHPAPRPAAHGRAGAVARRRVGLPVGGPRASRTAPGRRCPCRRTGCCTASRTARALRPALVHQRPVPVPDRPAARPGREPDGRLPADLRRTPDWDVATRAAALRRRRVRVPGGAQRRGGRGRQGQPARPGVRRHRAPGPRAQRARRAGAPVVVDELPRGPGQVVAAGDLPRRHAARPPGDGLDDVWLRTGCGGRPRDGRPGDHRRLPGHDRDPGAGRSSGGSARPRR